MEGALHDITLCRQFARLDVVEDVMPGESTVPRLRYFMGQNGLAVANVAEVAMVLSVNGLSMKAGTIVDATLFASLGSTRNRDKHRDPEMTQTMKGNQLHFGMKAYIAVDAVSGLIRSVECATTKVTDITVMGARLHGDEMVAIGDGCYASRMIEQFEKEGPPSVNMPTKKPAGSKLPDEQKAFTRALSMERAIVEHLFRVIKRQFGSAMTLHRYKF